MKYTFLPLLSETVIDFLGFKNIDFFEKMVNPEKVLENVGLGNSQILKIYI